MEKLDITHLIPNFILGDKNGWALAKALERGLEIYLDKIQDGLDAALNPDKMPEWRLDELAQDEGIFWYDYTAALSVKREMVKNARKVYAMLGTKAGVQRAAQDCASDAIIQEWFEYGGEAAHFRIYSRMGEAVENASAMAKSANDVKRLSSVLESIFVDLHPLTQQLYTGLALYGAINTRLKMAPYNDNNDVKLIELSNGDICVEGVTFQEQTNGDVLWNGSAFISQDDGDYRIT